MAALITIGVPVAVLAYIGICAVVCVWQWRNS